MAVNPAPGSILAADFGSVTTRVVLFDLVDGVYRLVAQGEGLTTLDMPARDVGIGLARILDAMTEATGRALLEDGRIIIPEQSNRRGVDHFVATVSAGEPMRVALVGLVPEISIASAVRAAAGTYIEIVETLSLADARSEEAQLNALLDSAPDVILIAGGTEDGAVEPVLGLARVVRLAVTLMERGIKPSVVYAGNGQAIPQVRAIFDGVTRVFFAGNVRPSLDDEQLEAAQLQLSLAFDEFKAARGSGFQNIGQTSRLGVMPTAQSFNLTAEYLSLALQTNTLLIDLGSATSTLSAGIGGQSSTSIRTDLGLGHSAVQLLNAVGLSAIQSWLPFYALDDEIKAYAWNKRARPYSMPQTLKELYIEHAFARAALQTLVHDARPTWRLPPRAALAGQLPPFSPIITAGAALTRTGSPGFNVLLVLDSLQPTGVTQLVADSYGVIPPMGALAHLNPEAAVQVLEAGGLESLGTSISPEGQPRDGRTAMKLKITFSDGQIIRREVTGGSLWVCPVPTGQTARVEINCGRGFKLNGKRRVRLTLEGGSAGLIFDGRGRPLKLPTDVRKRAELFPQWIAQVTGDSLRAIDEDLLVDIEEVTAAPDVPGEDSGLVKPAGRRGRKAKQAEKADKAEKKREKKPGKRGKGDDVPLPAEDIDFPEIDVEDAPADRDNSLDDLRNALS